VEQVAVSVSRSRLGGLWRWRSEAGYLSAASSGVLGCWHCVGPAATGVALGVPAVVAVALPVSRRFLASRFWVLFTRHRLQRSFWELRLHTRAGRLPLVIWTGSTLVGSRAWVMLRAGMTFDDFEDSAAAFAVACGARDCRVTASPRRAWLVRIDVIRLDALGPARVVRSPFASLPGIAPGTGARVWPDPAPSED
jgi:hypothetical protein